MGWPVSKHSEPARKLALFDSRLARLRGAIKAGEGLEHVEKAAEKLRLAALAVIKAKRALNREYPARDPDGRQAANLHADELRWQSLSTAAIVEEFGAADG
jgi:hypothetical protein